MQLSPRNLFHILLIVIFFLLGCKKENPNPELLDPIYQDLVKEAGQYKKLLSEEEKNLEEILKVQKNVAPRSIERKINKKEETASRRKILQHAQMFRYAEIRAERRRVEGRKEYRKAFRENLPWPNPSEYTYYKINKRLKEAPRNWGSRVPKLHKQNPNYKDQPQKK